MDHNIREEGGSTVVGFEGDIDLENSGDARAILLDCVSRSPAVVVDMSGVTMIDSSGVASLLEAFQSAAKKGKKFFLAEATGPVMRVLKLARLETVFNIVDSVAEGVEKAG